MNINHSNCIHFDKFYICIRCNFFYRNIDTGEYANDLENLYVEKEK